ncbi:thioredoxin reductase (NADPH) [Scopulibacillus darangshiensis]|uniref:Thioredoxin reductase (NADPH) n=1 Tax=Scopulibacillus darangshiensis TaxID=442528 RepID=A0A4R2P9S0_9BACL|nr:YpdA family putative bacillithiol disulfide reductase [Scopulibacillus darangshiensis]TCP31667.1 thioredoxin reductase (NADPH) [Scopulibacillus darangshiensis]
MKEDIIIIGAGPCGLSAAIFLQNKGYRPLVIEKGNVVQAIYRYPTHQQFFSSSEKLEIGDMPFVIEEQKPKRNQALAYYREVVKRKNIRIHAFEEVINVKKTGDNDTFFDVTTRKQNGVEGSYQARNIVVATGYYDHPNMMGIPGEDKDKVFHYFKEAHPYFDCNTLVIGGKNSAVDAAMALHKAGAHVTCIYRGSDYSPSVKPWILPEFQALVKHDKVTMIFAAEIEEIKDKSVIYKKNDLKHEIANDVVFAMTGYHPDHSFLTRMDVEIESETGRPVFHPDTMETNVAGIFIAGVIAAGNNANEIFIENGRFHGEAIANTIHERDKENLAFRQT